MTDHPFVHLHVHTEYSLLDGFSDIKKLTKRAQSLGMDALAISDHGTMFGVIDFYEAAKNIGIKPIIGMEGYITPFNRRMSDRDAKLDRENHHLLLLAQNETGYKNLMKIASAAQLEGYYYRPRIDKEFLEQHSEGLIATSTCLGGQIPDMIMKGNDKGARDIIDWYLQIFGKDRFYLELQNHNVDELNTVNQWLIDNGKKDQVGLVATSDVHYINEEDYDPHDTLLCIQTSALKHEHDRMRMSDNSYYLTPPERMWEWFGHLNNGEALLNTVKIAEMCDLNLDRKGYHLPVFPVPEGYTSNSYLRYLVEKGLVWRYGDRAYDDSELRERVEFELTTIGKMGFETYFLIVWDLCEFARHSDIWWNVRGSGAGSVVLYSLGITNIDPIQNNLLFERFLNPGRVTMPDIDMDFPDDRRGEMFSYTSRKYGEDKVAAIITFGTLGAKAAVRDVGRALGVDLALVNQAARLIPTEPKPKPVLQYVEDNPELKKLYSTNSTVKEVIDTASKLQGISRHASTHAAGVIVADQPLVEYIPLHRQTKDSDDEMTIKQVTQFPMETCEAIGLLKIDFLGLSTLTYLRRACDLIAKHHGIQFSMDNIPYRPTGDPEQDKKLEQTFQMLGRGETVGVFQLESSGMQTMLREMKPTKFENIVAGVSLYRPGPLEFIPQYNARMHGTQKIEYLHPKLADILDETYGIIVYQEQIMRVGQQLFGYSLGDADLMRKAVSKKKKDDLEKHRAIFMERGPEHGVPADVAEKIFDQIEFFANYGFNKCVVGDTEIIDVASGRVVRVEDLYTGRTAVASTVTLDTDTLKLTERPIAKVMANGVKPVYRLKTRLGHEIEATDNHPFFTLDGWQTLGELKVGDRIATPRKINVEGSNVWADHELIVLGHLLAEGNLCHTTGVYYYTTDDEQLADYVKHLELFDNSVASVARHKNAYSVYSKRIHRKQPNTLVEWIKVLGLWGKDSYAKFIPDDVFTLTNRSIALLISRMWEGDGHINVNDRSLFYATSSKRMAQQLQHLFLRFGIVSRLRQVEFNYKEGRTGYQLFITGNENLRAFRDEIAVHFVSERRREGLEKLVLAERAANGTKDALPLALKSVIRQAQVASGIGWQTLHEQTGIAIREFSPSAGKQGFTREIVQRLADAFNSPELQKHAQSDIFWDQVVSIEYVGEKPTYDLTIPDTHNFIANDIIVHNSHASDYAVITVQTAYLKCHYPAEYMAALLSTYFDDAVKVTTFLAECKRLDIPILPPDINESQLDFDIQVQKNGKRGIRFGLAAIKNAGVGALSTIIEERNKNGRFKDLGDFCSRVDLRHVGKRTIEMLVKVGAFAEMGTRNQLVAALDRIMSFSADQHRAREIGQISLFGEEMEASGDDLLRSLPNMEEVSKRAMLEWERELLGIYVSSHPIDEFITLLQGANVITSAEIQAAEAGMYEKGVRYAGLIMDVRKIVTKNQDMMAIVKLEDRLGSADAVLFPRTWAQYSEFFETIGEVVIVSGKLDLTRNEPQIIVEHVTQELQTEMSDGAPPPGYELEPLLMEGSEEDFQPPPPPAFRPSTPGNGSAAAAAFAPPMPPSMDELPPLLDDSDEPFFDDISREPEAPVAPSKRLRVRFWRSGSPDRDKWRLQKLVGEINAYPGRDHYEIVLVEAGIDKHIMRFDGKTTQCSQALIQKLEKMEGVEVSVEELIEPVPKGR